MKGRYRLLFVSLLILVAGPVDAQYYTTGTDPASIRWMQVKTKNVRLIYPSTFSNNAQYLANVFELTVSHETKTLSARVPRMPVILHSYSAYSNGLTVWAPRRIELFPCPPQSSYAEEWLEQLAIHEYRHAVQISKINQGFSKALYYIFGEQATGGILGLYIPSWFLEGDAVATETALSNVGRGRQPAFENILRAQLLEKGYYNYNKATMGSYITYTPDAYVLGYHLVAYGRDKYGPRLWNAALDRTAKLPFMVVPFNSGIHSITGMSKTRFYKQAMTYLTEVWARQDSLVNPYPERVLTKQDPKNYSDYLFPVVNDTTSVIALKSDMNHPDRIIHLLLETGEEEVILTPGNVVKDALSVTGPLLAWCEYRPDPRWEQRNYSVIRLHDMNTHRTRDVTRRSRYFFPAISPDAATLAAVHIDTDNNCSLDLLNTETGELIKSYPFPDKILVTEPAWSPEGDEIVFCTLTNKGKSLVEIKLKTDSLVTLIPPNYDHIGGPVYLSEDTIFFNGGYSGIDNLYYLDETTREIFQVTSSRFGAYNLNVSPHKKKLYWSGYTADGLMLMETPVDVDHWIPLADVKNHSARLYEPLTRQEACNIQDSVMAYNLAKLRTDSALTVLPDSVRGIIYREKKYSKWANLFNIHSWAPVSFDVNNMTLNPGVMVLSQNSLSSSIASLGYQYNYNDRTGTFYADYTYTGLYPEIGMRYEYGNAAGYYYNPNSRENVRYTWNESTLTLSLGIPWNFSHGKYYRFLTPRISTSVTSYIHNKSTPEGFPKGYEWYMSYGISGSNYLVSSKKDVYPRFGQTFSAVFRNSPFKGFDMGSILGCQAGLFFPGLFLHHGIWIYGGGQQRWTTGDGISLFSNTIPLPRGTTGFNDDRMFSVALNYKMPLFYPDWSVGSVLYIKRFSLNLFYDFAEGVSPGVMNTSSSTGAELTTNLHIARFVYPFELGLRTIYFPWTGTWGFEFLYAVDF